MTVSGLSDTVLSDALRISAAQGRTLVRVVANKYTARILTATPSAPLDWNEIGHGDVGDQTAVRLENAAKLGDLSWASTIEADVMVADYLTLSAGPVDRKFIQNWLSERNKASKGRNGDIDKKAQYEVASQAAWRCQFEGCGADLREQLAPGLRGNYGYFAHIVASSSDGPRGDPVESPLLASDATNVMLLCDKCHRLIDRIDPTRYGVDVLRRMRAKNLVAVKQALDTLRFPEAEVIVIGGNIEGQSLWVDERVAAEAMWLRGLRKAGPAEWFGQLGSHIGASNTPVYWHSLFKALESEVPSLKRLVTGAARGGARPSKLAIFPKHGTSVLVLFGRLLGELGVGHLFQPHRDNPSGTLGGEWAWPDLPPPSTDKFKVRVCKEAQDGDAEAVLLVNLTARVPVTDLPAALHSNGGWVLPAIELTVDECSYRVISHENDIELFTEAIGRALQTLQDGWRVRTVHLIVVAPTTACFRIGQKMQARHHADFVLYERLPSTAPGIWGGFAPTIKISSTEVSLHLTGDSIRIS